MYTFYFEEKSEVKSTASRFDYIKNHTYLPSSSSLIQRLDGKHLNLNASQETLFLELTNDKPILEIVKTHINDLIAYYDLPVTCEFDNSFVLTYKLSPKCSKVFRYTECEEWVKDICEENSADYTHMEPIDRVLVSTEMLENYKEVREFDRLCNLIANDLVAISKDY